MIPRDVIEMEALAFHFHKRPIRWKRSTGHFVDSHCRLWHITPIYGGLTRPERYELWFGVSHEKWKCVGSGETQRECKAIAENL